MSTPSRLIANRCAKVASAQKAAFFVPQSRYASNVRTEQCQNQVCSLDCEGNDFILGHNITPLSFEREADHRRPAATNIPHVQKLFKINPSSSAAFFFASTSLKRRQCRSIGCKVTFPVGQRQDFFCVNITALRLHTKRIAIIIAQFSTQKLFWEAAQWE